MNTNEPEEPAVEAGNHEEAKSGVADSGKGWQPRAVSIQLAAVLPTVVGCVAGMYFVLYSGRTHTSGAPQSVQLKWEANQADAEAEVRAIEAERARAENAPTNG